MKPIHKKLTAIITTLLPALRSSSSEEGSFRPKRRNLTCSVILSLPKDLSFYSQDLSTPSNTARDDRGKENTPRNDSVVLFRLGRSYLAVTLIFALILSLVAATVILFHTPDKAQAAWYTTGGTWNYRQRITIDHTKVPNTDQANFPVLVKITDEANTLFTRAQADGDDILFTSSDETTKLSHEIEKFTVTEGSRELIIWVKIPTLATAADTILYMYYGNATAESQQNATDVWSNGYAGVWHLGDSASPALDSTSNNNDGTQSGGVTFGATGKVDGAINIDGTNDYLDAGTDNIFANTDNHSVSAWVRSTKTGWQFIGGYYNQPGSTDKGYALVVTTLGKFGLIEAASPVWEYATSTSTYANDGLWHYLTGVRRNGTAYINIDGVEQPTTTTLAPLFTTPKVIIGWQGMSNQAFKGDLDNFRISNVARTPDWIATEYANQNDPGTFFSLGAEATGDIIAPTNPTDVDGYSDSGMGTPITTGNFYTHTTPYFAWTGAADTGNTYVSGVAGYYSYFGTSCGDGGGNPTMSRGVLSDTGSGLHYSTDLNVTVPDLTTNEGTYCLRMKTADSAGNISATTQVFTYKYDITNPNPPTFIAANPAGYSSIDSFAFSWPVATDPNAYASGVYGYQYKRGGDSGDDWSETITTASISAITSYQTGENIFIVRSVDNAGNTSSEVQTTYYYSDSAPTKPTGLTADPELSDSNSFSFSWTAPEHTRPITDYGYSINAVPTALNLTWTGNSSTTLTAGAFATIQGANTLYLIAKDDSGAYALNSANYATVSFNCTTVAPPIPTTVSVTDSSDRALAIYMLTLQWTAGTGQDEGSFDHYSIERSTDNVTFTEAATSTSTAYIDTGLNNTITYYYRIKSVDNADSVSAASTTVSKMPTGKYTSPPAILPEPTVSIKSTTATISWVVSRSSTSSVRFGTSADDLSASQISVTEEASHSIELVGLAPNTKYYYQVQSLDSFRDYSLDSAYSATYYFTTLESPSIANVQISNITLTSADISWETTSASNTTLYYGTSLNYGSIIPESDSSTTTLHSTKLSDLAHTTKYHFHISGTDIDSNTLSSDDYVFDTLPLPVISTIEYQPDFTGPAPKVAITWLTNVPTTSSVEYVPRMTEDNVAYEESQSALVSRHSVTLSNLLNETDYNFTVFGTDQFGNKAVSDTQILKTGVDSRSPVISDVIVESSNIGSSNTNEAKVIISWTTDELSTSQVAYDTGLAGSDYRSKTSPDLSLTKNHIVVVSGLLPGAPYHFRVMSQDETGNTALGDDQTVITGVISQSILNIISQALNNTFGWIAKLF